MKKNAFQWIALSLVFALSGCASMALRFTPSLIPNLTEAFFEECDVELAKRSLPAALKLMEGLLKSDPENKQIQTSLCMGFTGYALLFVEDSEPARASELYLRAKNYGLRAMGGKATILGEAGREKEVLQRELETFGEEGVKILFWTTMAWNGWIRLNLDKPIALSQLGIAEACLERVLELKGDYFYGSPYTMMGSILASKPGLLGGDPDRARQYFRKAMALTGGDFLLVQYYFARFYAVRIQDKELFEALLKEIDSSPPGKIKEVCLINEMMKEKAKKLMQMKEDLFL